MELKFRTADSLEEFFVHNVETADELFSLLRRTGFGTVHITIEDATDLADRKDFQIGSEWLRKIFDRYKFTYSLLILNMTITKLPKINFNQSNPERIVLLGKEMWLQFKIPQK